MIVIKLYSKFWIKQNYYFLFTLCCLYYSNGLMILTKNKRKYYFWDLFKKFTIIFWINLAWVYKIKPDFRSDLINKNQSLVKEKAEVSSIFC